MNVASLELCKELFALSGWDGSHFTWVTKTEGKVIGTFPVERGQYSANEICDAYDLGYLLRKIPSSLKDGFCLTIQTGSEEEGCKAQYQDDRGAVYRYPGYLCLENENTMEDAACKLAIELFKLGILTKETA